VIVGAGLRRFSEHNHPDRVAGGSTVTHGLARPIVGE
jgi:hypothetical protein